MTAAQQQNRMPASAKPNAAVADAGGGRAKQVVGGTEGFDNQAALLTPRPEDKPVQREEAKDQPAPAAPVAEDKAQEPTAENPGPGPEALSPLRQALLQQFVLMEGKGIGDAEFEAICGEAWWIKRKEDEKAAKKYNEEELPGAIAEWEAKSKADPEYAKNNKKPVRKDDANFTTCIATQGKLLQVAFKAVGLHVKKPGNVKGEVTGYATMGRIEATKRQAWQPASVNMKERPKKGDVLVLEMRGEPDKVQKKMDGESSQFGMFGQGEKKLLKEIGQLQAASQSSVDAIRLAAEAKLPNVEAKLQELRAKHDAKIAELQVQLDEARKKTAATAGTEKETKGGRMGGLEFSHVGMFNGSKPETDATGQATGKEVWSTFDGGQHVPGKRDEQGAKSCTRLYDPNTNEIASASTGKDGALTQDGKTRWLGGWVDIDALVAEDQPAAEKKVST